MIPLDFALVFALAGGLFNFAAGQPAPLASFFCVQTPDTRTFGAAGGYKTPAQVGKTVAGSLRTLESPDPGMGSPLKKTQL